MGSLPWSVCYHCAQQFDRSRNIYFLGLEMENIEISYLRGKSILETKTFDSVEFPNLTCKGIPRLLHAPS